MNIATIVEATASGTTLLALLGGGVFGLGKFHGAMTANTEATKKLTATFESHADKVSDQLANHETRITVLEKGRK